jgi:hypothetical protein
MNTVVASIDGMMSICDGVSIEKREKRLLIHLGIQRVEANFLTCTATVNLLQIEHLLFHVNFKTGKQYLDLLI